MKWIVHNAVNRDVERQQLNKILKEIQEAISSASKQQTTAEQIRTIVQQINAGGSNSQSPVSVQLTGDVTGAGAGTSVISIETTIRPDLLGVPEAPVDSNFYWRSGADWLPVPGVLISLAFVEGAGFTYYDPENGWLAKELVAGDNISLGTSDPTKVVISSTASSTGGVLPVVTGEVPPVLVYFDDGSLMYAPVEE